MLTRTQALEILQTLQALPSDKLAEVYDYLAFLRERYALKQPTNISDVWNDEDMNDLVAASFAHAEHTVRSGAQ